MKNETPEQIDLLAKLGKYDRAQTTSHPLAVANKKYLQKIADSLDHCPNNSFNDEVCFCPDKIDPKKKGVDVAFCVASGKTVLVEAKFGVRKNSRELTSGQLASDLEKKIKGSIEIIGNEDSRPIIREPLIVLFCAGDVLKQAKTCLFRRSNGIPTRPKFVVATEKELYEKMFQ